MSDFSPSSFAGAPLSSGRDYLSDVTSVPPRRVTLSSIAEQVGCSKNTVSLALRNDPQLPLHTRERIRKAAERLGYQPDAIFSHLMAQLRLGQGARFQAKIALVNGHRDRDAFRNEPTIAPYVAGCNCHASRLGYSFDQFWLHDPDLTAARWTRILTTRAIKGVIIVGLTQDNHLPEHLRAVWHQFPTVVTGVRTHHPAVPFSCVDHYGLMCSAVERALELGYRRPALVIDKVMDRLVEGRYSAGMFACLRSLPANDRVPTFFGTAAAGSKPARFHRWVDRHNPDVILTLYPEIDDWLGQHGLVAPKDLGIIHLDWTVTESRFAGMNQHNDVTGAAALDMIVDQIHHNEKGIPALPRARMVVASWMDGPSVAKRQHGRGGPPTISLLDENYIKQIAG